MKLMTFKKKKKKIEKKLKNFKNKLMKIMIKVQIYYLKKINKNKN